MNDALATTTTLLQLLLSEVTQTVTAKPPSSARKGETGEQLNVFLYSVKPDGHFRNNPRPGIHVSESLPCVLKYLITAYGLDDDDISGQRLMGKAIGFRVRFQDLRHRRMKVRPKFGLTIWRLPKA